MFSTAEKTVRSAPAAQHKAAGPASFFRKAGEESFFGTKENTSFFSPPVQTKLSVSTPDDPHEKEADAVAEKVVRMPEPIAALGSDKGEEKLDRKEEREELQTKAAPTLAQKIQCKEESERKLQTKGCSCGGHHEENHLQAKRNTTLNNRAPNSGAISLYPSDVMRESGRGPPQSAIPFEQTLQSSKGSGHAMSPDTQQYMESRFGADFSGVRIHTDDRAVQLSKGVQAQAFAHGGDIYFNQGRYAPDSTGGKTLLAHELTHTIQQGASTPKEGTTVSRQVASAQKDKELFDSDIAKQKNGFNEKKLQDAVPSAQNPDVATRKKEPESPVAAATQQRENSPAAKGKAAPPVALPNSAASKENPVPPSALPESGEKETQQKDTFDSSNRDGKDKKQTAQSHEQRSANSLNRLLSAEDTTVKTHVVRQATLINTNSETSKARVHQAAGTRINEVRNRFAGIREGITAFFATHTQSFVATVGAVKQFINSSITGFVNNIRSFITGIISNAIAGLATIQANITQLVSTITNGLVQSIAGITDRINNLINTVNLPDLPGIGAIRNLISGAIQTATSFVSNALNNAQQFINSIVASAAQVFTNLLQSFTGAVNKIADLIIQALTSLVSTIMGVLQTLITTVSNQLQQIIRATIWPALSGIENKIISNIEKAEMEAIEQIETNKSESLTALADALAEPQGEEAEGDDSATTEEVIRDIDRTGTDSVSKNKEIVNEFMERTGSVVNILFGHLLTAISKIKTEIQNLISKIKQKVSQIIDDIIRRITSFAQQVIATVTQLWQRLVAAFDRMLTALSRIIAHPIDAIVEAAESIWTQISSKVSNFARNAVNSLLNSIGVSTNQSQSLALAPAALPVLAPAAPVLLELMLAFGEIILVIETATITIVVMEGGIAIGVGAVVIAIPEEVVIIIIVVVVVIVVIIVVVVMVIVGVLVYLIYKAVKTKPKRPKRKRKCKRGEIHDPKAPSGLLVTDPIEIIWFKPLSVYENPITIGGQKYSMTSKKALPPPLQFIEIGVDGIWLPAINKPMLIFHQRNRNQQEKFKRRLKAAGYNWRTSGGKPVSPDHVQDLMWNGPDEFENLWPLESGYNSVAGRKQNLDQILYFRPDPKRPCAVRMRIEDARATFSEMSKRRFIIKTITTI